MARRALYLSIDQLHSWIRRSERRRSQPCTDLPVIFGRKAEADGVIDAQVRAHDILGVQGRGHIEITGDNRLSEADRPIMAAQAQLAVLRDGVICLAVR